MKLLFRLTTLLVFINTAVLTAQDRSFIIHDISLKGAEELDEKTLILTSGLYPGLRVSQEGGQLAIALKKLWRLDVFEDVKIYRDEQSSGNLVIDVKLSPRVSEIRWADLSKKEQGQLQDKIRLYIGKRLTPRARKETRNAIRNYFIEKGYHQASVTLTPHEEGKMVMLLISVDKGSKIKTGLVRITGNQQVDGKKLNKALKPLKKTLGIFRPFYNDQKVSDVKEEVISYYQSEGFADVQVDHRESSDKNRGITHVEFIIDEGRQYVIRNVKWEGNSLYTASQLSEISGIGSGMVYDENQLYKMLKFNPGGTDISGLYMDQGYLFFRINHTITRVSDQEVDLRISLTEGKVATIENIRIEGNEITNQHVILRQITTMPGDKFDRRALFESQGALARLGFFDPNTINVTPIPDPHNGTVDLVYHVDERPNDKYEFTGTLNGGMRFIGGVGLELNNFSSKDLFKFKNWKTVPRGDGERLSLRYNTAGKSYNSLNFSYNNPWLNTEKQTSFFLNSNISRLVRAQTDEEGNVSDGTLSIKSLSAGISKRLTWPDPFFSWTRSVSLTNYNFDNYDNSLEVQKGQTYLLTLNNTLARNTINHPFYPSAGSQMVANLSITPPYSLIKGETDSENPYKFGEYAKLMFDYSHYKKLAGQLVFKTGFHFGILNNYNKSIPLGPFERFHLGGSGLNGQDIFRGNDLVGLRGYPAEALVPVDTESGLSGGTVYQKVNVELRYPVILSQGYSAYIYGFAEAGNTWSRSAEYRPFDLYKSAGVGVRFNLPFVGQFGLDWAYGFDKLPGESKVSGSQLHFTIGMPIR